MKYIILIFACFIFSSCVAIEVKTPDGMEMKYSSYGDKKIGNIVFRKIIEGFYFEMNKITNIEPDIIIPRVMEIK